MQSMRIITKELGNDFENMSKMQKIWKLDEVEMAVLIVKRFANYTEISPCFKADLRSF